MGCINLLKTIKAYKLRFPHDEQGSCNSGAVYYAVQGAVQRLSLWMKS